MEEEKEFISCQLTKDLKLNKKKIIKQKMKDVFITDDNKKLSSVVINKNKSKKIKSYQYKDE